jgi:hypothetical protein
VAGLLGGVQASQISLHHGAVPFDGEDQRDVHRDALTNYRGDRRQGLVHRRDLDQQVGSVDDLPQFDGLADRLIGIMGQTGIDFDGHPPVDPVGVLEDLGQQIAGPADVIGGDGADRGLQVGAAVGQLRD